MAASHGDVALDYVTSVSYLLDLTNLTTLKLQIIIPSKMGYGLPSTFRSLFR